MAEYIDNGAGLGWLIDPVEKCVHVYRSGHPDECLENPAEVSGEPNPSRLHPALERHLVGRRDLRQQFVTPCGRRRSVEPAHHAGAKGSMARTEP